MAEKSAIEWTESTWNPVTGCTKLSAGCDNCYAERFAERFRGVVGHPYEEGFDLTLRPERVDQPKSRRRPRLVFVNSMSDLFHEDVPWEYVERVFGTMEAAHWQWLVKWYRGRLKEAFGHVTTAREVQSTTGRPLYYLIFAGPHKKGAEIANHVLKQGARRVR